jgi:3-oxoacyl-[acyl-carrier-protein] synthase II
MKECAVIVDLARIDSKSESVDCQVTSESRWMFILPATHSELTEQILGKISVSVRDKVETVISCSTLDDGYAREICFSNDRLRPKDVMNALGITAAGITNQYLPNLDHVFKIDSACSSGMSALEIAVQSAIFLNKIVLILAVDKSTSPRYGKFFHTIGALSVLPREYCTPFSKNRNGFAMGEGAAAIAVTSKQRANELGLPIIAEINAVQNKTIFTNATRPSDPVALTKMINDVVAGSKKTIQDLACWDAHATATPVGDQQEFEIFQDVVGNSDVAISSFKGQIGHCMSSSAVIELANAIEHLQSGQISPNYNLQDPMSDDPRLIVKTESTNKKTFVKTSFGFGGRNGVAVITIC